MVAIPKEVTDIMGEAVKVLVTASASGQPHAIVCGSILAIGPDKVAVGEVLMKRAKENLAANGKVAMLITAGPKSYELVLANGQRSTEGPLFDNMKAGLAAHNLPCFAAWAFDVVEVWNESAGPGAGSKIA